MTVDAVTARLYELAVEVAALLNGIGDDDEREHVQERYERRLNDELFHGSELRMSEMMVAIVDWPTWDSSR